MSLIDVANLDIEGSSISGVLALPATLSAGQVLTINAVQADGLEIAGTDSVPDVTGSTIHIVRLEDDSLADLRFIAGGVITATVTDDMTFAGNLGSAIVTVDEDWTLTLTAGRADGKTIHGTNASVIITELENAAAAHLEGVDATTVTAQVTGDVTFTGDLGIADVTVARDATLILAADQATDRSIVGAVGASGTMGGAIVVTGLDGTDTAENDGDGNGYADAVYHFADIHAGGAGSGQAGSFTVQVSTTQTLNSQTTLGDATVVVADAKTLTLSADQSHQRTIEGTGNLVITDLSGSTDLSALVRDSIGGSDPVAGFTGAFSDTEINWDRTASTGTGATVIDATASTLTLTGPTSGSSAQISHTFQEAGTITLAFSIAVDDFTIFGEPQGYGAQNIGVQVSLGQDGIYVQLNAIENYLTQSPSNNNLFSYTNGGLTVHWDLTGLTNNGVVTGIISYIAQPGAKLSLWSETPTGGDEPNASVLTLSNLQFMPEAVSVQGLTTVTATIEDAVVDIVGNDHLTKVDAYQLADNSLLKLSVGQALDKDITGGAGSSTLIVGDVTQTGVYDLSGIATTLSFDDRVYVGETLASGSIGIGVIGGATLVLGTTQASNNVITGNGTLKLSGDVVDAVTVDLRSVSTAVLSFQDSADSDNYYNLTVDGTLKINAAQADGQAIWGSGSVQIDALEDRTNAYFYDIDADTVTIHVSAGEAVVFTGELGVASHQVVLGANADLTLMSGQADGRTISGNATNTITVMGLAADADLSYLSSASHVVATVTQSQDVSLNENLGTVDVFSLQGSSEYTVDINADLGVHVSRVDLTAYVGKTVNIGLDSLDDADTYLVLRAADGTIKATDDDGASNRDSLLSNVVVAQGDYIEATYYGVTFDGDAPSVYTNDTLILTVTDTETSQETATTVAWTGQVGSVGPLLTLTAAQADQQVVNGDGSVHITGDVVAHSAVDLRSISTAVTFLDQGETLPSIELKTDASLTLFAAQANGVEFTGADAAGVEIYDSVGAQSISGSAGNDIIHGGAGLDAVNLSQGGVDTLLWSGLTNDMAVTGFASDDVLDFSQLSTSLYNSHGTANYESIDTTAETTVAKFTSKVVGILDLSADTEANVEAIFKAGQFLNNKIDAATGGNTSSMVFLIANNDATGQDVNVWRWTDSTGGDGNVQAAELSKLGTLDGFTALDLVGLTGADNKNFIV